MFGDGRDRLLRPRPVPGAEEITLLLADDVYAVWREGEPLPYWAFAWPGGQAVARWVLDDPDLVRGATVLDLGCASGLVGIAAARAGAARILCVDVDPRALTAAQGNAACNGVEVETVCADLLAEPGHPLLAGIDLVVAGDLVYVQPLADRVVAFLRDQAHAGRRAVLADASRPYAPTSGVRVLAELEVPVDAGLERGPRIRTQILEVLADIPTGSD